MISEQVMIKPFGNGTCTAGGPAVFRVSPIEVAQACYRKWKSTVPFAVDLAEYLRTGIVIARPDIFVMAKIIDIAPEGSPEREPAWFFRIVVGDIREVRRALPGYLPKVCFCRRNDARLRVYSLSRITRLIMPAEELQKGEK